MSSKRAWLLVGFMWVAYFLNYSDRQVVFSIFPLLKSELHFTNTQLGLTSSIFLWVYAFCSPIAGQLGDRFSKRILVVLSLCLWSIATFLTGFSHSVFMLLSCRALIGVTESLFVPAAVALTASAHSPALRSRAVSLLNTAQLGGVAMGGWYGGFIAQRFHWRWAFYSLGLYGVLYAIPYLLFLRKTPEAAPEETRASGAKLAVTALIKVRTFWVVCVIFSVFTFVLWLLYTWLANFFYERFSLSLATAGFTATAYLQGATFVGMLCGSAISDALYRRHKAARFWMVNSGLLLAAPCVHWIGHAESLSSAVNATIGFGFACGLAMSSLQICTFDVIPIDTRASALGFLNLVGAFVSGFAALLGGVWKESIGIPTLMSYAALACFIAGLLMVVGIKLCFQRDYERVH